MFCQGFSIHVYPGRHCGSCFICMSVIFIVPVDVLPYGCQAICRHSADHPNGQCFDKVSVSACNLEDIVVPVFLYECALHCACWCPASMDARPSADTVLITQIDSVLIRCQYRHVLWKTLWFLSYLYECDLHCACWCPASMDARPSADTVLITQIDSVLIRCRYRHVIWKTLWFLSYLYECDLHCACWCPASMDARPSADTVLITQIDSVLIRSQCRHVLWKTLWFLSYLYECDLHCACWCPASMDARPSADTVLVTQFG